MANPLGTVFSRADALKRQLYDMLSNPRDYASMVAGRTQEAAQAADALEKMAFADPQNPLKITNPQALNQLTQMITSGPLGFAPAGITAFHGSPYLFRQFDPAKVGAGEGAQAYGVGAGYTAEARSVAEAYAQANKGRAAALSGEIDKLPKPAQMEVYKTLNRPDGFIKQAEILDITKRYPETTPLFESSKSYLYKGDIPDEILPKFLDWDKKFSDQTPEVKEAVKKYWNENKVYGDPSKLSGAGIYDSIVAHVYSDSGRARAQQVASSELEKIGIRGIRYLDEGSRKEGKGTSNFVPFRPEDFKIQEINDIPIEDYIAKGLL